MALRARSTCPSAGAPAVTGVVRDRPRLHGRFKARIRKTVRASDSGGGGGPHGGVSDQVVAGSGAWHPPGHHHSWLSPECHLQAWWPPPAQPVQGKGEVRRVVSTGPEPALARCEAAGRSGAGQEARRLQGLLGARAARSWPGQPRSLGGGVRRTQLHADPVTAAQDEQGAGGRPRGAGR